MAFSLVFGTDVHVGAGGCWVASFGILSGHMGSTVPGAMSALAVLWMVAVLKLGWQISWWVLKLGVGARGVGVGVGARVRHRWWVWVLV
jgi:hypothetical protein